jgi:hypothetical protein
VRRKIPLNRQYPNLHFIHSTEIVGARHAVPLFVVAACLP